MTVDGHQARFALTEASEGSIEKNLVISPYAKVDEMTKFPK